MDDLTPLGEALLELVVEQLTPTHIFISSLVCKDLSVAARSEVVWSTQYIRRV